MSCWARLAVGGAPLLVATLDGIADGSLRPQPQPADGVSHAPKLTVADAEIRFDQPAMAIDRRIRACTPEPGAWTRFRGDRLKLGPVTVVPAADRSQPGPAFRGRPVSWRADRAGVLVGTAHRAGPARHRAAGRQAADAGRRLGQRRAAGRGGSPWRIRLIRPARWPSGRCRRYRPRTPTPTWCCRGRWPRPACPAGTPRWPPNSATARCARPARWTRCCAGVPAATWPTSSRRC